MSENRFNNRIKLTQDIVAKIAKIDQFQGFWQGSLRFSPQILGRLKAWVIITSTGASTRIEGAKMTDEEIARFLRGLKAKAPKSRDEQEYADLIGRIFDNHKTIKFSEKQLEIYNLFDGDAALSVSGIDSLLKGKTPRGTIKQAVSRLAALRLIEGIGQARSTRYRKNVSSGEKGE